MSREPLLLLTLWCALVGPSLPAPHPQGQGAGGASLDLGELEKMGISAEDLVQHLRRLAEGNYVCGYREISDMKRHFLRNRTVTCNDGSPAGYYLRRSTGNSRWLVFLEGGWYCFDYISCQARWIHTPHLMSSEHWPDRRKGTGILSWDPEENPFLYNANLVYVPYCSSDTWSGTYKSRERGEFSYMGALILEEVIRDLVAEHGMSSASKLYLAGSSAGGTGVLVNLDRVAAQMATVAPQVEVRGIADSGWFLDNRQYKTVNCVSAHSCSPTDGVQKGIVLWQGQVPDRCKKVYPEMEVWKCYFGYRIYATLKTPVFVVQHLFDEAQITADNVGPPINRRQWQYIHDIGQDMKQTLLNVSAVFAPACLSHIVLSRSDWAQISIYGVTLPDALKCWEDGKHEHNLYEQPSNTGAYQELVHTLITGERPGRRHIQGDQPRSSARRHRCESKRRSQRRGKKRRHRKRKKEKDKERRRKKERGGSEATSPAPTSHVYLSPGASPGPVSFPRSPSRVSSPRSPTPRASSRRPRRSTIFFDLHDLHHMHYHDNQCSHQRLDHCAWPQCNFSCPKIHNPFTGQEMDFIDLLMQFGLDLSSIADALDLDLPTLQTMDHDTLLRMLIRGTR